MSLIEEIRPVISDAEYVLLLDGGGTRFRWCLYHSKTQQIIQLQAGDVISEQVITAGGNINSLGEEKFLSDAFNHALDTIFVAEKGILLRSWLAQNNTAMLVGMAGMSSPRNQETLRNIVNDIYPKMRLAIYSDVDLYLASIEAPHIIVIAGTGSAVKGVGTDGHTSLRKDGFGQSLSGDPGSAYAIGNEAFRSYLELCSGCPVFHAASKRFLSKSDDIFFNLMQAKLKKLLSDIPETDWVSRLNAEPSLRGRLSNLVVDIFDAAFSKGSLIALQIVNHAAQRLAEDIACIAEGIGKQETSLSIPVTLVGGLFSSKEHSGKFIGLIQEALTQYPVSIKLNLSNREGENFVLQVVKKANEAKESAPHLFASFFPSVISDDKPLIIFTPPGSEM